MIVALKMCAHIALWALIVLFNFILWFLFGLLLTGRNEKNRSIAFTVLVGFFLYYSLFTLFALPVMYRWRPLSMLAALWGGGSGGDMHPIPDPEPQGDKAHVRGTF